MACLGAGCLHGAAAKMNEASWWTAVSSSLVISYVNNVVVSPMTEATTCKKKEDAIALRRK